MCTFPQFKKLEISDKSLFYSFTNKYLPYSDFNFISLWSYDDGKTSFSILNNNLIIVLPDYITNEPVYSFLGTENTESTVKDLLEYIKSQGSNPEIKLLPQVSIESKINYLKSNYSVIEDRDSFDYILSTQKMTELSGSAYHDQRNLIRQIEKKYPDLKVESMDLSNEQTKKEIMDLCYLWGSRKHKSDEELERELSAIKKLLSEPSELHTISIGIHIEDKLAAFFVGERVSEKYAIGHYRKADTTYHGIFTYIDHKMAELLLKKGCEYFNFEQDMGIESLRKAKESWQPVFYLKKYILSEIN